MHSSLIVKVILGFELAYSLDFAIVVTSELILKLPLVYESLYL